jgi:hypothetical protein
VTGRAIHILLLLSDGVRYVRERAARIREHRPRRDYAGVAAASSGPVQERSSVHIIGRDHDYHNNQRDRRQVPNSSHNSYFCSRYERETHPHRSTMTGGMSSISTTGYFVAVTTEATTDEDPEGCEYPRYAIRDSLAWDFFFFPSALLIGRKALPEGAVLGRQLGRPWVR